MWRCSRLVVFQVILILISVLAETDGYKDDDVTLAQQSDNYPINRRRRAAEQILGGKTPQDPSDPKYRDLAEESMEKYMANNGLTESYEVLQVNSVTGQVVAGYSTDMYFDATIGSSYVSCHSIIWERPWLKQKDINVTCSNKDCK